MEFLFNYIRDVINLYSPYFPFILGGMFIAMIIAPIAAQIAGKIGAVDLPATLRSRSDPSLETRISDQIHPKLAGFGLFFALILILVLSGVSSDLPWGVFAGLVIIAIYGFYDDWQDLSFAKQLFGQFLAAACVVLSGLSFTVITLFGNTLHFDLWQINVSISTWHHTFSLPGDIIAILWIMAIINFVNWVGGVDGLNNSISAIVGLMILTIALGDQKVVFAWLALAATHIGGNIGTLLFIYPPAKAFNGAVGEHINGFLLAVLALATGTKSPLILVALGIPIVDALWVMFNRIKNARMKGMSIKQSILAAFRGDRTHLHHRLLDLGFSRKGVLFTEVGLTILLTVVGFQIYGTLGNLELAVIAIMGLALIVIAVLGTVVRKRKAEMQLQARIIPPTEEKTQVKVVYKTNENDEKFVY